MNLWILYVLSTFILTTHCQIYGEYNDYNDPTARILETPPHWKPVQSLNGGSLGPHFVSIGNPPNNLQLAQIAHQNPIFMQQFKALNSPVTQYRNPFPVFPAPLAAHHHHHQHYVLPKENFQQQYHQSASNIAQTVVPQNYLKPAPFITGKPAFNLKPEYISKQEFYNGIPTAIGKVSQFQSFKPMPGALKQQTGFRDSNSYNFRDFGLTPPPAQLPQRQLVGFKQLMPANSKAISAFSFPPSDGVTQLSFFGPASHLIRGGGGVGKPQAAFFLPSEVGNNIKNIPQFLSSNRPFISQAIQQMHYESSTPNFFGATSVKISPSQSYEITVSKAPIIDIPPTTTTPPPQPARSQHTAPLAHAASLQGNSQPQSHGQNNQIKSQVLPPIPASVLTPFFQQVQQQQVKANEQAEANAAKNRFVNDEYSDNLVPPPFIHLESSTFRSTSGPSTSRPISPIEQANALNILNKYNIPVISPLQDATKFKYSGNYRQPTLIPLNYTITDITTYPTSLPAQVAITLLPTDTKNLNTPPSYANFNGINLFEPHRLSNSADSQTNHQFRISNPPIPQKEKTNTENTFFTIQDAITSLPIHEPPSIVHTSFNSRPNPIRTQVIPETTANEVVNIETTTTPRIVISEYKVTTTTAAPITTTTTSSTSSTRNRLRGKNRRRRPRPTTYRTSEIPTGEEDNDIPANWQEQNPAPSSTTDEALQRRRRPFPMNSRLRSTTLSPADPTLRVIQRNSLKNKFDSYVNMPQRQSTDPHSTTTIEYHPPSIRTTQVPAEEAITLEQDAFPSTTALVQDKINAVSEEQQTESINPIIPETSISSVTKYGTLFTDIVRSSTDLPTFFQQTSAETHSTDPVILDQIPSQPTAVDSEKSSEDIDSHLSHRQRYRYRTKPSTEPISEKDNVEEAEESSDSESSSQTSSTATDENIKPITRLRPANKYISRDRPRFSVKDYRQRSKPQPGTTSTTDSPSLSSTTSNYRSRLRFPTRKRLLPSLRLRGSTTEKDNTSNSEHEEIPSAESSPETVVATSTARTTRRRYGGSRRTPVNRFQRPTSTTEVAKLAEETERRPPIRHRFTSTRTTTTEPSKEMISAEETAQEDLAPAEDLNNIAVDGDSESVSSTEESKLETAIMKINKAEAPSRQSAEESVASDSEASNDVNTDLNQAPSEHSERVAQLTISGNSNKFNNLNNSNLSRRIPGHFTLATEDPILPIEAFFPNVKPNANRRSNH